MTNEQIEFPGTWEEYEKEYGFNDSKEVYTNNSRLIQSFRVKQWLDHLPSIQPKEKVGHWMNNKCSECGEKGLLKTIGSIGEGQERTFVYAREYSHYCPNCGAKMMM